MAAPPALRVVEAAARVYRRTWRGSVISCFLNPVLYLLAMGVGLGKLVDQGSGSAGLALPYLTFLAPGLLAANAMQTAAGDASHPVMAGIKWRKTYHATLATPIGVRDLVLGHLGWVTIRVTFVSVVYAAIMTAFGATNPLQGLLAVPPAILTGAAIAAAVTAYTAHLKDETGLNVLFRFILVPLFLFSGTFFPVSQLPDWIEPLAYATPLFHGVSLCRGLALEVPFVVPPAISTAYLAVWLVVGGWLALRIMRRRLVV
jgi:lipooligosaccharide transport system permease protein